MENITLDGENDNQPKVIGPKIQATDLPSPTLNFQSRTPPSSLLASPAAVPPLQRRSRGKVARLPLVIRNLVNQALRDGRRYAEIVALLDAQGFPSFTEHNISNWLKGGYRDWLANQERFETRRPLSDRAKAILGQITPAGQSNLVDLNESLLAAFFHELLLDFDASNLAEKTDEFLRVAKVLASFISACAQRKRADIEQLQYQLQLRKLQNEKKPSKLRPVSLETINEFEADAGEFL